MTIIYTITCTAISVRLALILLFWPFLILNTLSHLSLIKVDSIFIFVIDISHIIFKFLYTCCF